MDYTAVISSLRVEFCFPPLSQPCIVWQAHGELVQNNPQGTEHPAQPFCEGKEKGAVQSCGLLRPTACVQNVSILD